MPIRERLQSKARLTRHHPLKVEDDAEHLAALDRATAAGDEDAAKRARARADECYEWLLVTALTPREWEALLSEHPATDEQRKTNPGAWAGEGFVPALLAATIDGPEDPQDWREYLEGGPVSPGEARELVDAVIGLHERTPAPMLGKGSMQTASSP